MAKYRADHSKYENKLNESELLGDRHPHCLMVLESCQELFKMQDGCGNMGKGNLAMNYLDTLILRLNVRGLNLNTNTNRLGRTNGTGTISP